MKLLLPEEMDGGRGGIGGGGCFDTGPTEEANSIHSLNSFNMKSLAWIESV